MARLALAFFILCLTLIGAPALADPPTFAQTVSACGTPGNTPVVGQPYPQTQDTSGKLCTSAVITGSVTATTAATAATSTAASGTVTLGGTFQSIIAASGSRKGCFIENPTTATEPLYVFFGANGSATTGNSVSLAAGQATGCTPGLIVLQDNISVTATTTGHAFTAFSQ